MDIPTVLPTEPAHCRTLREWRELCLGSSQAEIARASGLKQSRISAVESGRVMPRKRHWARLILAYQRTGQLTEAEFYRMLMAARLERQRLAALPRPIAETEPLFATAQTTPKPVLRVSDSECESGSAEARGLA